MDNLVREGEQAMDGQSGGGNNQGNMGGGGGNMDQQGQGNMGGGGGNMNEQSGGNQSSGGGGGFMSGLENTGKDAMIDQGKLHKPVYT